MRGDEAAAEENSSCGRLRGEADTPRATESHDPVITDSILVAGRDDSLGSLAETAGLYWQIVASTRPLR
jgi:hypothetical protein